MNFVKPRLPDSTIRLILSLLGGGQTWDDVEDEAQTARRNIGNVKGWYNSIAWGEAKIYAEGDEKILKTRTDYLKMKAREALREEGPRLTRLTDRTDPSDKESPFKAHCDNLTSDYAVLDFRVQLLRHYADSPVTIMGNIVDGFFPEDVRLPPGTITDGAFFRQLVGIPQSDGVDDDLFDPVRRLDRDRTLQALCHFNQLFPDQTLRDWRDITAQNARKYGDALSLLGTQLTVERCPECEVCKLLGLV